MNRLAIQTILYITLTTALSSLTACDNSKFKYNVDAAKSSSSTQSFTLASVNIVTVDAKDTARASFDTSAFSNGTGLGNYCTTTSCQCEYRWDQAGAGQVTTTRQVFTAVSQVMPFTIECDVPDVYKTEIGDTTVVNFRIVPTSSGIASFSVAYFAFSKAKLPQNGAFSDYQGHPFDNVFRYSCYENFRRGTNILNYLQSGTLSSGNGSVTVMSASRFCYAKGDASNGISQICDGNGAQDNQTYSAQSYYYNLYIRGSEIGGINTSNSRYMCPTVLDVKTNTNKYYPLDSNFALAMTQSADYSIGVEASSRLGGTGDPLTSGSTCSGGKSTATNNDSSILSSCLGFALRTNKDGSCPKMQAANGAMVQTYRLRRFVVMYPTQFNTNGAMVSNLPPAMDTVYALDRPVGVPDSNGVTDTMMGPKPCPFAYYDNGVTGTVYNKSTGSTIGYLGTNNSAWNGKNIDGTHFPDQDKTNSCSTAMPLIGPDRNNLMLTFGTVNASNPNPKLKRIYVRPQNAWSPHYEEDTDFLACAPVSSQFKDPPIHISNTGTDFAYCAEAYPTHRENMPIEQATSHIRSSVGFNDYCAQGQPCNHTVSYAGYQALPWKNFSLLAPQADVTSALQKNPSYVCKITSDRRATPTNPARLGLSPQGGCCYNASSTKTGLQYDFHLEDDIACGTPTY